MWNKHIRIGMAPAVPAGACRPAAVLRRIFGRRHRCCVDTVDQIPDMGEPPAQVAEKVNRVKAVADKRRTQALLRHPSHVIRSRTNAEAWKAAHELIQHVPTRRSLGAEIFSRMDSIGQQRMAQLHGGRRDKLEISPNSGPALASLRGGAGTAPVVRSRTGAARIREYKDVASIALSCRAIRISRKPTASPNCVSAAVAAANPTM